MPNISSVINYFPTVYENNVALSLGGSIIAGATTVPVSGMSNYSNGQIVVFTVDAPTSTLKQVFTGTVSGANVVNAVWTYGTNQPHSNGAPVIDNVAATTFDMVTAGILKQHNQNGTHKSLTTDTLSASGASTLTGPITGAGYSMATMSNPYKFFAYRTAALSQAPNAVLICDTKVYDTGTNYSVTTGLFTTTIAGFYDFRGAIQYISGNYGFAIGLIRNGTQYISDSYIALNNTNSNGLSGAFPSLYLNIGDTVGLFFGTSNGGLTTINIGNTPIVTWFSGSLISQT